MVPSSCRASFRALAASSLFLAALLAGAPARAAEPIRIGSNVVTGLYFPTAGAICRLIVARPDKAEDKPRCLVESTAGSVSNLRALQRGDLEFAVVQSDWLHYASSGQRLFKDGGALANIRAAAALYAEALVVLVRADSKAHAFDDLRGQKFAAGPQGGGARSLLELAATTAGWKNGELSFAGDDVGPDPLCAGKADAAVALGAAPWPQARALARNCAVRAIPIAGDLAARAMVDRPWLASTKVPAGAWPGSGELETIGLRVILATRADLDADRVYATVKAIAGSGDELAQQIPALHETRLPEMASAGIGAPMHPGAARFYREAGLRERIPEAATPPQGPAPAAAGPAPSPPPAPIEPAKAPTAPAAAPPPVAPKAAPPAKQAPGKSQPADPPRK